jgi:hypothetical protein
MPNGPEPLPNAPAGTPGRPVLRLYLADTRQLFNSMDPAPFQERDLDPAAETYIVDWARETRRDAPLGLVLHLGDRAPGTAEAAVVRESLHEFFRRRALGSRRRLRRLFRAGRVSLAIAFVFLTSVTVVGEVLAGLFAGERSRFLIENSLMIGSWVALWRPLEIFLYDWWPIRAEARLYDRLSAMDVRVVDASASRYPKDEFRAGTPGE